MNYMKKRTTLKTAVRLLIVLLILTAGMIIGSVSCEADPVETVIEEDAPVIVCSPEDVLSTVEHEPSKPETVTGRYASIKEEITQKERGLLALVIYHESRGECIEGQEAVAETVFNRYLSHFDGKTTIESLIYAKNQFSCSSYLTTAAIHEPECLATAFDIIDRVIDETEYNIKDTYMYFNTKRPQTSDYVQIGSHYFY